MWAQSYPPSGSATPTASPTGSPTGSPTAQPGHWEVVGSWNWSGSRTLLDGQGQLYTDTFATPGYVSQAPTNLYNYMGSSLEITNGRTAKSSMKGTVRLRLTWTGNGEAPTWAGVFIDSSVTSTAYHDGSNQTTETASNLCGSPAPEFGNSTSNSRTSQGRLVARVENPTKKTVIDFIYPFSGTATATANSTGGQANTYVGCDASWGLDNRGASISGPGFKSFDASTNTWTGDTTYSYVQRMMSPGGAGGWPPPAPYNVNRPNLASFQGTPTGNWSPPTGYIWSNPQPGDTQTTHSEEMPYGPFNKDLDGNWVASGTTGAPGSTSVTYTMFDQVSDHATAVATYKLNLHNEWENWRCS